MTLKRRVANKIFSPPLTKAELTGIPKPPKRFGKAVVCVRCGSYGFGGLHKLTTDQYACNDKAACEKHQRGNSLTNPTTP